MKRVSILAVLLLAASAVTAQSSTELRDGWSSGTISVTGEATIMLVPDVVTFTVGVQTLSKTVKAAVAENNAKTESILKALRAGGAKDEELQTRNFSVWPQMNYRENQAPVIQGYQVSNEIVVRKDDPAAASTLLSAAIDAGANTGGGLSFVVSDPAEGDDEGLVAAYINARSKAELLAQAAGRTLAGVVSINEGGPASEPRPPTPVMRDMAMSVGNVPVEKGTQQKTYTVSVVFALD